MCLKNILQLNHLVETRLQEQAAQQLKNISYMNNVMLRNEKKKHKTVDGISPQKITVSQDYSILHCKFEIFISAEDKKVWQESKSGWSEATWGLWLMSHGISISSTIRRPNGGKKTKKKQAKFCMADIYWGAKKDSVMWWNSLLLWQKCLALSGVKLSIRR